MVVSMLKAARKTTGQIRSNLHTGQYASSISPGHSQGKTLVEPLALSGVTRYTNKFLCKTTQKPLYYRIHTVWTTKRPFYLNCIRTGGWIVTSKNKCAIMLELMQ